MVMRKADILKYESAFNWMEDAFDLSNLIDSVEDTDKVRHEAAAALVHCVNTKGCVDLRWMSKMSDLPIKDLKNALEGAIFQDPEKYSVNQSEEDDWILRNQYISGNIKRKLSVAKRMDRRYSGRFQGNIRVLEEALPEHVRFEEIGISIGSSWVPAHVYMQFAKEILALFSEPIIRHSRRLGQWKVKMPQSASNSIQNLYTFGTPRMTALQILEHTLNASTIRIYDEVPRPNLKSGFARVLNKSETIAAQEKQEALQRAFQKWVGKDPERVRQLEDIYYESYVCNTACRFDGRFLTLPDLNPAFVPYPHQKNAVAHIVLEKDVILNHIVGSGKTNCLIMGIHERKRMGISEINLFVVPNHVLDAFAQTHRFLYPGDRILVIHPEDFTPLHRQEFLEKIRDEDTTAVYMAFSSFDMVCMSRRSRLEQIKSEIGSLRSHAETTPDKWEKKALESLASRKCKELVKLRKELPEDLNLPFDELGITTLAVDEAHNYKNISLQTRAGGVVGLHPAGSKKCTGLLEKSQYVRSQGGSLLFSTGTPLTNSISDLYVLQHYLQPEQLNLLRLGHFDEWIASFATKCSGFEIDVDSRNFRIMTRFSHFHNLPELISLFANVCDYYQGADIGISLPACDGYIDTVILKSDEQEAYIEKLVQRTEKIRARMVRADEDNLLMVTNDGRAAALDIRLADPGAPVDPESTKTRACAVNVYKCWLNYPGTAQLVFCDIGTPKTGFNIYDELKKQLIEMGIPDSQIAFIHNARTDVKRRKLFEAVNSASVRVLVGSTSKLGTGVNVQNNLIAVHHLDVPWKPSDIVQREGRLIRQGNRNSRVFRYRYITAGTFDAYSWQIVENKQRFIGQFMSGTVAGRDVEDIDDTVLTYAEIKALSVGDPLIKTRIETSNELERLKLRSHRREQELRTISRIIQAGPSRKEKLAQRRERLRKDKEHFTQSFESISREERIAFGEDLLYALQGNVANGQERLFDHVHGFKVLLPAYMKAERPYVLICGVTENRYEVDMQDAKEAGCVQRIEYLLLHLGDRISAAEEDIRRAQEELRHAGLELATGNPYAGEAAVLKKKLLDIDRELSLHTEGKVS